MNVSARRHEVAKKKSCNRLETINTLEYRFACRHTNKKHGTVCCVNRIN
jgi:hypothetical protein